MPELPEVETLRRQLAPALMGKKILAIKAFTTSVMVGPIQWVRNRKVIQLERRGKYLVAALENGFLVFHLGMTGQLILSTGETGIRESMRMPSGWVLVNRVLEKDPHVHLGMEIEGGAKLVYRDVRKFGRVFALAGLNALDKFQRLNILGPDPLVVKGEFFIKHNKRKTSQSSIKAALLDQRFLSGVGNIYADEALYDARINPATPCNLLLLDDWKRLLKSIQKVLKKGIKNFGTTFSDFRQANNRYGKNQERLLVYGRAGKSCRRCGTVLIKTVVAARGTVSCAKCQNPAIKNELKI